MADPAVRERAKELFVENGFSMETILTLLDKEVSRKTLYNWRKEDGWGALRIQRMQKQQTRREKLEALLDKYLEEADTASSPNLIFAIGKIVAALKSSSQFQFTDEKKNDDDKPQEMTDETWDKIEERLGLK